MWRILYLVIATAILIVVAPISFLAQNIVPIIITAAAIFVFEYFVVHKVPSRFVFTSLIAIILSMVLFIFVNVVLSALKTSLDANVMRLVFIAVSYVTFGVCFVFLPDIARLFKKESDKIKYMKILDTSVVVDGRILEIAEKGFFDGYLVVPEFVIKEIQLISDSHDRQKRIRGRRALDILNKMKASKNILISITDIDFPDIKEVDLKLIELAKKMDAKIISNDFNLMKVASIHGVDILNINTLANTMHVVVIPEDILMVNLVREGKDKQALAYLEDGTMIVVDNAKHLIGKDVEIKIDNILPKEAGRVIFASLYNSNNSGFQGSKNRQRFNGNNNSNKQRNQKNN